MERVWNLDGIWGRYFERVGRLSLAGRILLSLGFAFLTGLSGQIYVRLPFTPVPITGQVFVVLLAGILLGKSFGGLSQAFYALAGLSGIRWFSAGSAGVLSPTFGYIAGFIPAAYLIGWLSEKKGMGLARQIFAMLAGVSIIYACGVVWLSLYLRITLARAVVLGALPFIPFDILKAYLAGTVARSILNERP